MIKSEHIIISCDDNREFILLFKNIIHNIKNEKFKFAIKNTQCFFVSIFGHLEVLGQGVECERPLAPLSLYYLWMSGHTSGHISLLL